MGLNLQALSRSWLLSLPLGFSLPCALKDGVSLTLNTANADIFEATALSFRSSLHPD